MLKILDAINLSSDYLEKKGIESPKINAELLLAHILNCKRLDLYLSFDKPLKEEEIKIYREFIRRRADFEPLQYILGQTEFYGMKFLVNREVLIPRQETEILVEKIIENFTGVPNLSILDIGTGSGNITLALLKNLPDAKSTAVDINSGILELAKKNALLHELQDRVEFKKMDILNSTFEKKYDIIVSNPPYISLAEYVTLQREITEYEPRIALTDEGDGFKYYRIISGIAMQSLNKNGKLYFEIGHTMVTGVKKILEEYGYKNLKIYKDYLNINRVISGEQI